MKKVKEKKVEFALKIQNLWTMHKEMKKYKFIISKINFLQKWCRALVLRNILLLNIVHIKRLQLYFKKRFILK